MQSQSGSAGQPTAITTGHESGTSQVAGQPVVFCGIPGMGRGRCFGGGRGSVSKSVQSSASAVPTVGVLVPGGDTGLEQVIADCLLRRRWQPVGLVLGQAPAGTERRRAG